MQKYPVKADGLLSRNRRIKMREIEVSMLTDVVERGGDQNMPCL